jgi:hypothetical protein
MNMRIYDFPGGIHPANAPGADDAPGDPNREYARP